MIRYHICDVCKSKVNDDGTCPTCVDVDGHPVKVDTNRPFDVVIFFAGVMVSMFSSIENGIFATIGISIALLLFRFFKAHGRFLGRVKVRSIPAGSQMDGAALGLSSSLEKGSDSEFESVRDIYLPLDKHDGSNPRVELERPYPGMFIYRFTEGFNYPNANNYTDHMVKSIMEETRATNGQAFEKPGVSGRRRHVI